MRHERLPDCRAQHADTSLTCASSHPELMWGEFAMRPRIDVHLTAAERKSYFIWSRAVLLVIALIAIGTIVLPALNHEPTRPNVLAERNR
jgi:hypothetical protein